MNVLQFDEVAEFASRASDLLLRDEARHNLALGLLGTLEEHPWRYPEHRFWLVEERGTVVGGALRTPPHGVVLAQPLAAGAIEALATGIDEELPGAVGATPEIESFAEAWSRRHGVPWRTRFRQRIFELEEVIPPRPCPGTARVAGSDDRALLVEWLRAFSIEAVGEGAPRGRRARSERRPQAPRRGRCLRPLGSRGRARLLRGVRKLHTERHPDRAGLHPSRAPRPRLRERSHRARLHRQARRGQAILLPPHEPR